jgi:hypothetical protein
VYEFQLLLLWFHFFCWCQFFRGLPFHYLSLCTQFRVLNE